MKFVPKTTVMNAQDLEKIQQQHEAMKAQLKQVVLEHSNKVDDLNKQIYSLTLKKNNLEVIVANAIQEGQRNLDAKNKEVDDRLASAKRLQEKYTVLIDQTNQKLSDLEKSQQELEAKHKAHTDIVNTHRISVEEDLRQIAVKDAASNQLRESSNATLVDANSRIEKAIAKENKIEQEATQLVHIQANIEADIKVQKQLYIDNKILSDQLEKKKTDAENLLKQAEYLKTEAVQIRDDCDKATARLGIRKQQLDDKEKDLKNQQLKIDLANQTLKSREEAYNDKMSKLTDMQNTVQQLIDKQAKGG